MHSRYSRNQNRYHSESPAREPSPQSSQQIKPITRPRDTLLRLASLHRQLSSITPVAPMITTSLYAQSLQPRQSHDQKYVWHVQSMPHALLSRDRMSLEIMLSCTFSQPLPT